MTWYEEQVNGGWKGPLGQPRGSTMAKFPLRTGVRYRVSMNPDKGHYLMPGEYHSYCGLTLAPEEEWLVHSGYDAYYWIVVDDRQTNATCRDCLRWRQKLAYSESSTTLPTDSPIPAQEWEATVGVEEQKRASKLDSMAATIASWIGSGATVVGKETDERQV